MYIPLLTVLRCEGGRCVFHSTPSAQVEGILRFVSSAVRVLVLRNDNQEERGGEGGRDNVGSSNRVQGHTHTTRTNRLHREWMGEWTKETGKGSDVQLIERNNMRLGAVEGAVFGVFEQSISCQQLYSSSLHSDGR